MAQPQGGQRHQEHHQQGGGFFSSLYYTAGAASGLVEGYVLLCKTLASELTGGKLGLAGQQEGGQAGDQPGPVLCEELQERIMRRIASAPGGMSPADLAAELACDPQVQAALPEGTELQVDFVSENGEVLHANEMNEVRGQASLTAVPGMCSD